MSSPSPPHYIANQPNYLTVIPIRPPSPYPSHNLHLHPITTQPGSDILRICVSKSPSPGHRDGIPPGLDYLTRCGIIVIKQKYERMEIISGWECRNKYSLRNSDGEQIYFAEEVSACCERQCCGAQRGFKLQICDDFKREVMKITRRTNCTGCCFGCDCCGDECIIESPPGVVIGSAKKRSTWCIIALEINDAQGRTLFNIDGPCGIQLPCQKAKFPDLNDEPVGMITKHWGGVFRETVSDADYFTVSFPVNLDVRMKSVLIGATFLIDFMAFENNKTACDVLSAF